MAARWLVKTEPDVYSWAQLLQDGSTGWDGVRNNAARVHLKAMKKGDRVLYYHTGDERSVVGIAEVVREAYPDASDGDPGWVQVDLRPVAALKSPVTLAQVKAEPDLSNIALVRQARLSVMPIDDAAWKKIVAMGGGEKKL
jgi:predicted RNA-binding protein with PUA-like domain